MIGGQTQQRAAALRNMLELRLAARAPGDERRTILKFSAAAGLATAAAIVILITQFDFPPLVDWPNHMARHYLEALALSGQMLPPGYAIEYAVMPNLGSDLIVPYLVMAFGHITASKTFLILSIAIYFAGPALFVLQQGSASRASLAAACLLLPWLMAGTFFWGFINYYSGVGLAFLAAANHARIAKKDRVPLWQLTVQAALLVLLYLWHLTSIGIFLVLAGCHALSSLSVSTDRLKSFRRQILLAASAIPALVVMISVMLTPQLNALSGGLVWSAPLRKLTLIGAYFVAYMPLIDMATLALWCLAIVLMFKFKNPAPRALTFPALSALAFLVLYVILPVEVGTTSGADIRMLPPLLICGVAALATLPLSRLAPIGLSLILIASVVRTTSIAFAWSHMEHDARALSTYFRNVAPNARILVLTLDRATKQNFQSHLMGWAVPQNGAYVSNLFSYAGQQTLSLLGPKTDAILIPTDAGHSVDIAAVRANFDYVWVFNPASGAVALPSDWKPVLGEGAGKLFKVQ